MTTTSPPSFSTRPDVAQIGAIAWVRKHLFSGWFNSLVTVVLGSLLIRSIVGFIGWATTTAQWKVIPENLPLYFVGQFPADQYWRIWALLWMLSALSGLTWGNLSQNVPHLFNRTVLIWVGILAVIFVLAPTPLPYRLLLLATLGLVLTGAWAGRYLSQSLPSFGLGLAIAWGLSFFIMLWLMAGGFGLKPVSTTAWGGLLLTLFMSVVSIVLCFPLGVALALGRQSTLPVVRLLSTVYIEVVRGVPLIALLFIGAVMLPFFLPGNVRLDLVLRAIFGLTLFSAAYLAENVRGGLQSIPRGQAEASSALGLNTPLTLGLIVLPQALKVAIPSIVGQFISLVQDTTLVSIIGLSDLMRISRAVLANPLYIGRYAEVYLFIGVIFWVLCYAMSWGSRQLEARLRTTN